MENLLSVFYSDRYAGKAAYINENLRLEEFLQITWLIKQWLLMSQLEDFIKKLKPDIIVKGKEHEQKFNIEKEILRSLTANYYLAQVKIYCLQWIWLEKKLKMIQTKTS